MDRIHETHSSNSISKEIGEQFKKFINTQDYDPYEVAFFCSEILNENGISGKSCKYSVGVRLFDERQEPNPCNFCSTIYPDADTQNIVFRREKYSDVRIDSFITIDDKGKCHVNIDPGDPYELGYLVDIKFCPYCGRKLVESEET